MNFFLLFVFVGVWAFSLESPIVEEHIQGVPSTHDGYHTYKLVDKDYLKQYKDVLRLFKYVHQLTYEKDHVSIAKKYSVENSLSNYNNEKAVNEFLQYYKQGMLPRNEIFSTFYDSHLKQAIALFKILYYAKDFDTFYKTAVWARYHLNQGLFLYSCSVALIHRHDTYSMVLPPIYEIYPYYFFNSEVIQKAQEYKQLYIAGLENQKEYAISANYSGWYLNLHPEQSLSYFTEDIGINAYYYYYNLYRPFWMDTKQFEINTYHRGEEFYYFYQQLLARYYLERLSNDFGEISTYDYENAFETGYYSSLCYPNGLAFPQRTNWVYFFTNYYNHGQSYSFKGAFPYSYYKVVDYERRIRDAMELGFVYTEDGDKINLYESSGFNVLGNIIESNPDSPNTRFYGYLQIFARHLLGYSQQPLHEYKVAPSALEHFETSLRDPAFWQLYKRLILYFQKYKYYLPRYTYDYLVFEGVKIENMQVDPLITYFEKYDVDLSNAVYINENEWKQNSFAVHACQYRLNHKSFSYRINITSDTDTEGLVRVFIGPKYDEYGRFIHIDENRINFVEFDSFIHELKAGLNVIERNSHQNFYASDRTTYRQLYENIMAGIDGTTQFTTHGSEVYYAFPNRLLLPKGKHGGQIYQFYVIVNPCRYSKLFLKKQQEQQAYRHIYEKLHEGEEYVYFKHPMVGLGIQYLDDHEALGYPFDRPIDEHNFYVPNSYFQDVTIYHKQQDDINSSTYDNTHNVV